ncbi:MAG: glycoside hydrolase family 5 protein [Chloroflexi bacterium CFX4]|nr:glycoside hydrolase family 5 protein [Chloroflexi bacterium CFX4]MDL1924245.1 glycoside hydrolase family 5 protein [Chloroflexi bacterium CFX3]
MRALLWVVMIGILCLSVSSTAAQEPPAKPQALFSPCINLGNMLEAPNEGEWGVRVEESYLPTIAAAGFKAVRIPVRWSAHAAAEAPYTIDAAFLARVRQVVDWALAAELEVVLNVHHYEEIMTQPQDHVTRLIALWEQIGAHFADYPPTLAFELLNEPNNRLDSTIWNVTYPKLIAAVRQSNPTRTLIIGGAEWNGLYALRRFSMPVERDNLIITFHYYEPFQFTHQGAEWVNGADAWLGQRWGTDDHYSAIARDFTFAAEWSARYGVPLWLGEFGAYEKADLPSRQLYTQAVREAAERNGIGWCYWEFASGFGIYDPVAKQFKPLFEALIPPQ